MINNATPHDSSLQDSLIEFSKCSFYFEGCDKKKNLVKATLRGENVLLFTLKEENGACDVFITIPDNFTSTHYYRGKKTLDTLTKDAHLSYHGKRKGKKISGEIHLKTSGVNKLSGASEKLAAPLATANDIEKYPLPICRIELNLQAGSCQPRYDISNFFELHTGEVFFNTIEVHLARAGFLHSLASCSPSVTPILRSIFINTSMRTFFLDKMERRPGLFPQVLALKTKNYEIIISALHEYRNPEYKINSIQYFHTKNYYKDLVSRSFMSHAGGWFVDAKANEREKAGFRRLTSLLS